MPGINQVVFNVTTITDGVRVCLWKARPP